MITPRNILKSIIMPLYLLALGSCGSGSGVPSNQIALPVNTAISFFCAQEGIYLENCIFYDPANPYAYVQVDDTTKWDLDAAAPSAKAKFYLWATALANSPTGENQFYVAKSLHELYTVSGNPQVMNQALLAYKSVLDNFFGQVTYFKATWVTPPVTYAKPVADLVGDYMYNPLSFNLASFYMDPVEALAQISAWGYVYNPTTGTMSIFQ